MSHRVVVIDDDADLCELMGKVLLRAGHEVTCAHSGEAGLAELERQVAHCVVVDKRLPQMNGLEVLAEVRRRWPTTAVVLVTAYPEPFTLDDAARPDATLAKPFKRLADVEEAVREALEASAVATESDPLTNFKERVAAVVAEITPGRRKRS